MRILLCEGSWDRPLNPNFLEALLELSDDGKCEFKLVDEAEFFPTITSFSGRLWRKVLGKLPVRSHQLFNRRLLETAIAFMPDLLLMVNGKFAEPATLRSIKRETNAILANYATDDPFNPLVSTRCFRDSIREFDVYATPKKAVVEEIVASGCSRSFRTHFAYKPSIHFPELPRTADEKLRFDCDVVFIGSCDRDRIDFLRLLTREFPSLRLAIYGSGHWERYRFLRPYIHGVVSGRDFRLALGGSRIALNFLRHANRDDHSERAFQILACGAFMLSERSDEQVGLFAEGKEAAYFTSPQELLTQVRHYLTRDSDRRAIAAAGRARVLRDRHRLDDRLVQLFSVAFESRHDLLAILQRGTHT
jgi:hypothetical protein